MTLPHQAPLSDPTSMEVVQVSLNAFKASLPTASSYVTIPSVYSKEPTESISEIQELKAESFSSLLTVPDNTPHSSLSFNHDIDGLPTPFPDVFTLEVPYVRELGVKGFVGRLAEFFGCRNYTLNKVQFWFLDVVTDCFWKLQDDFKFPEVYQKFVVTWILHAFDMIRDRRKNLCRKEFFQIFNDSMLMLDERVQSGCKMLPLPQDLFEDVQEKEQEEISLPTNSEQSSSVSLMSSGESYVAVGIDESLEIFEIPKIHQKKHKETKADEFDLYSVVEEDFGEEVEEEERFYQPDLNTPPRFYPSTVSSSSSSLVSSDDEVFEIKPLWKKSSFVSYSSSEEKLAPSRNQSDESNIVNDWLRYLDNHQEYLQDIEFNIQINTCAIRAIRELVYYNFYDSFQYKMVKLALLICLNSITKNVNSEWNIPKFLKQELKKPKPKKEKKKKKKKDKKSKKTKKRKDKHKKKKQKKSKKGSKKSKSKKSKPKKLTKAELARLKRERLKLLEEARIAEENRRMIFPLNDAVDDDFFKSIFDNWKKPKKGKKKKKKGKGGKRKK